MPAAQAQGFFNVKIFKKVLIFLTIGGILKVDKGKATRTVTPSKVYLDAIQRPSRYYLR